jgi:hypothetical protein
LTKDSFLVTKLLSFKTSKGQVTLDLADYQQEEIVSKWFQLDNRLDRRDPNLGQLLLKFQLLQTERGKMYKLNDYLEVDFYDPLKDVRKVKFLKTKYFTSIPSDVFCALFDHNKFVPNETEIAAITTVLIDTEIKTTKVLQFIIKEEVNQFCFFNTKKR